MASHDRTSAIEHEVRIAASRETVFAYFVDPAKLVQWLGADATIDPRAGGICRITFNEAATMLGRFVEVDPPRLIRWTWGWEQELFEVGPQSTSLEVLLVEDHAETIVRLRHGRLPTGSVAFHRTGWQHHLARLTTAAGGSDPGPDPWRDAELARRELERILRSSQ